MIDRRRLLALTGSAGLGAAMALRPRLTRAEGGAVELRAAPAMARLAPADMPETAVWAFGGAVPGPEIRVAQGARVTRRFVNDLPQPSAVHWHGLRLPNAMDGVPHLTQEAVPPGGAFLYDFVAQDAGTFWFHSHARSFEQVARGLYGPLIVEEAAPPDVDRDATLMLDDWRLGDDAQIVESFGALHDAAHAGRIGNWITVNGAPEWRGAARAGDRLRLRLVNAANARVMSVGAQGLEGWVAALDGMPLARPEAFDRLTLAPAQRADLLVDVTAAAGEEALLISFEREGAFALGALSVAAGGARRPDPAPLQPNPVPPLGDLAAARRATVRMEGGAMGGMGHAMLGGERMGPRELAAAGKVWAFNGRADMPEAPLIEAALGETLRLSFVNDTAWPHAIHLHGTHFRRLGADGAPGPLRDVTLLARGETAEIAFVADNPGDWLIHCHMLEHAAGGMTTWLRVV
ncbi:multicopper oxidase family protein [Rubrimonas cliftonensis]|uniref:Multicopper oxidase with three cupredoxin domains (Includes cell division protein FtsP and spore coat protein CotA) n=1 Tax=Rubrimonas cliftonensis TaxID=89524 RepID=A0A1H4EBX0_9RHOB|nr:multicopper oxidase family protein [Rubrimonas cliftonensis]SEA82543.1 Multicopper oxidase with three cupredoxin domains (includes cell division protein FtsP and spore coat protein CotA) [Rubrimonas cliftonensis]